MCKITEAVALPEREVLSLTIGDGTIGFSYTGSGNDRGIMFHRLDTACPIGKPVPTRVASTPIFILAFKNQKSMRVLKKVIDNGLKHWKKESEG